MVTMYKGKKLGEYTRKELENIIEELMAQVHNLTTEDTLE